MSKMMIYAALSAIGGNIENVYGHRMRVRTIDASDKGAIDEAKAEGWKPKADDVIEQIETEKLEAENKVMKDKLSDGKDDKRVAELEAQLAEALTEIAGFDVERSESNAVIDEKIARIAELEVELAGALIEGAKFESDAKHSKDKLVIYEKSKDTNDSGKVDYEEMTNAELQKLLEQRKVDYNKRDGKDALIKAAKDSE